MKNTLPPSDAIKRHEAFLRDCALAYPRTHEDFPWGERAIKVDTKVFVFLSAHADGLSMSVKLPHSREAALALPFTEPTHYGLGRSGWVTASFEPNARPPLEQLRAWIDESYRAIAPKKLVATLPSARATAASAATSAAKSSAKSADGTVRARKPKPKSSERSRATKKATTSADAKPRAAKKRSKK